MSDEDKAQRKAMREAVIAGIDAWLDKKFTALGVWTLRGIAALVLAAIVLLLAWASGWRPM